MAERSRCARQARTPLCLQWLRRSYTAAGAVQVQVSVEMVAAALQLKPQHTGAPFGAAGGMPG